MRQVVLALVLAFGLSACGDDPETVQPAQSVSQEPSIEEKEKVFADQLRNDDSGGDFLVSDETLVEIGYAICADLRSGSELPELLLALQTDSIPQDRVTYLIDLSAAMFCREEFAEVQFSRQMYQEAGILNEDGSLA